MSNLAKVFSLDYNSAAVTRTNALKSYYRSVRLIKTNGILSPTSGQASKTTNILLCGNCIDPETADGKRCLYVFYIDTDYNAAWIIEIDIDSRIQNVVYYDKDNKIGFDRYHKIYNARVVEGRIIWTDNINPVYQIDVRRAKNSWQYKIGYGQYPITTEWDPIVSYGIDRNVTSGNNFYRSKIDNNINNDPRFDGGINWYKLCLIEDAYYSMDVKNLYFEPVPPKHPPVVTYQTDDTRKINNLRQTLFQFAYRYVYMDWRRSTFSPASIVPVPQAEEETATGLASERPSLNNKLQISVNSGGEEVRSIEIVARSSSDPSKWFLVDTIDKFSEEEKGNELSATSASPKAILGFSVKAPVGVDDSKSYNIYDSVAISLPVPITELTWVHPSVTDMDWLASQSGSGNAKSSTIDIPLGIAKITYIPSWMTGKNSLAHTLLVGTDVIGGDAITLYPVAANLGAQKFDSVIITDAYGNTGVINVTQEAYNPPPVVNLSVLTGETWSITGSTTANTYVATGSTALHIGFMAHGLEYPSGQTLNAEVLKNGVHLLYTTVIGREGVLIATNVITLLSAASTGDVYDVILSSDVNIIDAQAVVMTLKVVSTHSSWVHSSLSSLTWNAAESGSGNAKSVGIDSAETSVTVTAIPDWMTGKNSTLHTILPGTIVLAGTNISLYPLTNNTGALRTGSIVLVDAYNNVCTITVTQNAAIVITDPVVNLSVILSETWTITENTTSNCYVSIGSTTLHVGFKAHDLTTPGSETLSAEVIKNGVHLLNSTVMGRNEYLVNSTITLPVAAVAGDVYDVILDESN